MHSKPNTMQFVYTRKTIKVPGIVQRIQTEGITVGSSEVNRHHQINLHPTCDKLSRNNAQKMLTIGYYDCMNITYAVPYPGYVSKTTTQKRFVK